MKTDSRDDEDRTYLTQRIAFAGLVGLRLSYFPAPVATHVPTPERMPGCTMLGPWT